MKTYRFIGKDGSMGFRYNRLYKLLLFELCVDEFIATFEKGFLSNTRCPYSSLTSFLKNWEEL